MFEMCIYMYREYLGKRDELSGAAGWLPRSIGTGDTMQLEE